MSVASKSTSATFRRLHAGPEILILPNAWDAGSAKLIESIGAKAIATSSAAVAWSHGYPDGDTLPTSLAVATVAAVVRVVRIPVSADIEGGYSTDPAAVGELAGRVVDAGAVGINLEDGAATPDLTCAKIEQVKRAAARLGDLYVNARTDVYLRGFAEGDAAITETIARGRLYREAGADGLFVPGLVDIKAMRAIIEAVNLPLNVMAFPGLPSAKELGGLGVRRLSAGAGGAMAALEKLRAYVSEFLGLPPPAAALSSRDLNRLYKES